MPLLNLFRGRAAIEFAHHLLEGELFRVTLGEFRFACGEFSDRFVAFRLGLVSRRFELGQCRIALGEFFRERGTSRTLPGTIVRARSDEFGNTATEGAEPLAGYVKIRIRDSKKRRSRFNFNTEYRAAHKIGSKYCKNATHLIHIRGRTASKCLEE